LKSNLFQTFLGWRFIAETHNSAKVWIVYTEYTILDSNESGGILHLKYKSDITTFSVNQNYRWRYHRF